MFVYYVKFNGMTSTKKIPTSNNTDRKCDRSLALIEGMLPFFMS
jgi:hypothetical protein